jgi:hypothetical protein
MSEEKFVNIYKTRRQTLFLVDCYCDDLTDILPD